MNVAVKPMLTRGQYDAAFEAERNLIYPAMDEFERQTGFALNRDKLEAAARVLACPVKANPPSWQHGRLLYSVARTYLARTVEPSVFLDVGTAKGFSALCLRWAADDNMLTGGYGASVTSVDVINPKDRVRRNTVAEVEGLKTLAETLADWPEASRIQFLRMDGAGWLKGFKDRVNLAFLDGKHSHHVVSVELKYLAMHQQPGDIVVLDDVHMPGVMTALEEMRHAYGWVILRADPLPASMRDDDLDAMKPRPERSYAVASRKRPS